MRLWRRGNITGYVFEPAGIQNFKLQEVTDYFTDMPIYIGVFGLVMNWDKWNSLPPEYQAVIESFSLRPGSLAASADMQAAADKGHQVFIDAGAEWVTPTDDAKAAFAAVADEVAATWPTKVELPGFDAPAYMADALSILETYRSDLSRLYGWSQTGRHAARSGSTAIVMHPA